MPLTKAQPTGVIVGTTDTQTLTGKTLTSPVINTGISGTGIAAGSDVTTGTSNTLIVTPKAIGDAGVNTRLKSKVIHTSRDLSTASGDVAYTGVGFTPSSIIVYFNIDATVWEGHGMADSTKTTACDWFNWNNYYYHATDLIHLEVTAGQGVYLFGTLKSYDADGFTITYTKGGAATGIANLLFMCYG